jgi:antitoxin ParD1/3/4
MPKPVTTQLPEHLARYAESEVAAGHFSSVEDVVEAGLTLLRKRQERHDAEVAAINAALEEGERSGIAEDYSLQGTLAKLGLGGVGRPRRSEALIKERRRLCGAVRMRRETGRVEAFELATALCKLPKFTVKPLKK